MFFSDVLVAVMVTLSEPSRGADINNPEFVAEVLAFAALSVVKMPAHAKESQSTVRYRLLWIALLDLVILGVS
jgi:hypothetical protein